MKRILSITLVFLLLTSSLHLTVASHYCGGTLAQVKWSFNHELAGCGMEGEHDAASCEMIGQPCCQDEISTYATDNQYQVRSLELNSFSQQVFACYAVPVGLLFKSQEPADYRYTPVFPPGIVLPTQVAQESICVFLI